MGDQEKKATPKRLGGLNSGLGRPDGRLGVLRGGDGAGPSSQPAAAPAGNAGARKMRFLPTNFQRAKKAEDSASTDLTSLSLSVSKSESQFDDLMKQAKTEANWSRRGRGRGAGPGAAGGRGPSTITTFGGGAGEFTGRRPVARGGGSWGGKGGGRSTGPAPASSRPGGKAADGEEVKDEEMSERHPSHRGGDSDSEEDVAAGDMLDYLQYYPTMLPLAEPGAGRADEAKQEAAVPPDILSVPEDIHGQQAELGFLHDIESNDGRLMIFQLPAALPIPLGAAAGAGPGPSAAAAADGRPAQLPELGMSRIGKLLVFESGAIKLQVGEVLMDVTPGVPCQFRQDVAVVNPQARQCIMLAPAVQRVVCSPDLETLLSDEPLPQWARVPGKGGPAGDDAAAAMDVDVDASVAGGGEQQQQQQPAAAADGHLPQIKEEDEVQSPRARGVPRSRKQAAAGAAGDAG